jgi:hypothetical protein
VDTHPECFIGKNKFLFNFCFMEYPPCGMPFGPFPAVFHMRNSTVAGFKGSEPGGVADEVKHHDH